MIVNCGIPHLELTLENVSSMDSIVIRRAQKKKTLPFKSDEISSLRSNK